jgi:hypothetical protein
LLSQNSAAKEPVQAIESNKFCLRWVADKASTSISAFGLFT